MFKSVRIRARVGDFRQEFIRVFGVGICQGKSFAGHPRQSSNLPGGISRSVARINGSGLPGFYGRITFPLGYPPLPLLFSVFLATMRTVSPYRPQHCIGSLLTLTIPPLNLPIVCRLREPRIHSYTSIPVAKTGRLFQPPQSLTTLTKRTGRIDPPVSRITG